MTLVAMPALDRTHDPTLQSWVETASHHADFPIQNLPLGIFSPAGQPARAGIAVGDSILDLPALLAAGLLTGEAARAAAAASGGTLNALFALGDDPRRALRARLSEILCVASPDRPRAAAMLHDSAACTLHLPAAIGDYTDFYAGIHHATNVGRQFRPDNPLLPNYKHIPVGYHGRASSVRPSGAAVHRPGGQTRPTDAASPNVGPSRCLDYELELGVWIGPGNAPGHPVPIGRAADHIAGYCLLNDWSARDIQAWEYQPLGPFLSKNFATTVSCWVVTPEALAPFRIAQPRRPEGDPEPLPYLVDAADQSSGALGIELEVLLLTQAMRQRGDPPHRLAASHARHLYWTTAQMVAHHTSGGCDLRPGDLLGTGTISGPDAQGCGSLLELTSGGRQPVELPGGEQRGYLEDGDEVLLRGRACRDGFVPIGFGPCRAVIQGSVQAC